MWTKLMTSFFMFTGTKHGYHITTIAMYMNELIRRVDPKHRPLHQFFKEEFAEPLGQLLRHFAPANIKDPAL